jgi:hypothetical protein
MQYTHAAIHTVHTYVPGLHGMTVAGGAHVRASYAINTDWHRAVCATPATVAVAAALQTVTFATAVVQLSDTCQEAGILAHEVIIWALRNICNGQSF